MAAIRRFWARLAAFVGKDRMEAELDEEIRFHIEMEAAENRRRGLPPAEAYRTARLRFGGVESVKAACRDTGRLPLLEMLAQDVRHGLRRMARSPGLTVTVILTLALGIGATSTLWSVIDAVLLRPLPYPRPDRLVAIELELQGDRSLNTWSTFEYVRRHAASFEHLAGTDLVTGINMVVGKRAEHVDGLRVSAGYFEAMGILPERGRSFSPEDEADGAPDVAILSRRLTERHFRSLDEALGSTIELGGVAYSVIGVLPARFRTMPEEVDVFRPLHEDFAGGGTNLHVVGRLRDDATLGQARGELAALSQRAERPEILEKRTLAAVPYRESLTWSLEGSLLVLLGAVAMVLLIACANVACLLLVAAMARRREMALRRAVGGGRRRLVAQVLTESLLLALGGGLLGVAFAYAGVRGMSVFLPAYLDLWQISLDHRVLALTLAVTVASGLAFGLAPALEAVRGRRELGDALAGGGERQTGGRRTAYLRRTLVLVEVVLSVTLLIGAGLLIRTFYNLKRVELGFEPEGVLTAQMSFQGEGYADPEWITSLFERTLERIRQLPGVEEAAVGSAVPVRRGLNLPVHIPGSSEERVTISVLYVTPGYFRLLGVPHLAGRPLADSDTSAALPVGVVNQAFVRRILSDGSQDADIGNALGRNVEMMFPEPGLSYQIVGVVGDVKDWDVVSSTRPTLFVPVAQVTAGILRVTHHWFPSNFLVRLRGEDAAAPIAGMREAVASIDPSLPFSGFRTMDEVISRSLSGERFLAVLLALFAALALLMAAAGLYGLLAYSVVQRRREIGVRVALGATGGDTLRLVVREGLGLAVVGVVAGSLASLGLARLLESFVYGVSATDPATYVAIAVVLLAVALLASALPARKAVRLDPMSVLREE